MVDDLKLEGETLRKFFLQYKYNEVIRRLSGGVAHNYNNIFAGLSGQLSILSKDEGAGGKSSDRIDLMHKLLQRGITQTEVLYDFSRRKHVEKKYNSPGRLAKQAIDILNALSRQHTFELQRDVSLPRLYSHSQDIMLMLIYLGENAMESMADGGNIQLRLAVSEDSSAGPSLSFTMIDSGSGFPEEILKSAFEPFVTTKRLQNLRGLGMYAAQTIADDHQGDITIEYTGTEGTEIAVRLPVEESGGDKQVRQDRVAVESVGKQMIAPQVFLVVEDEEGMRNMLYERLQRRGHTVVCARSCEEAVKQYALHFHKFTVILLDMHLSDGYGFDCARKLFNVSNEPQLIFMSGSVYETGEDRFSVYPFLKKPFSINTLEAMVNNEKI